MTRFDASTFREQAFRYGGQAFRVVHTVRRQPTWVGQIATAAGVLVFLAILLLLIVPAILVGVLVFLAMAGVATLQRALRRLRAPNGPLDGRRNVRVVVRRD